MNRLPSRRTFLLSRVFDGKGFTPAARLVSLRKNCFYALFGRRLRFLIASATGERLG